MPRRNSASPSGTDAFMKPCVIETPQASSSSSVIVRTSTPMGAEATTEGRERPECLGEAAEPDQRADACHHRERHGHEREPIGDLVVDGLLLHRLAELRVHLLE